MRTSDFLYDPTKHDIANPFNRTNDVYSPEQKGILGNTGTPPIRAA